jgi:Restriction endonuclease S subunits
MRCSTHLNPDFLNFTLNSPQAKDYCMSVKTDGVSQSNINAQKIGAYIINCPPTEEQTEIVRRVDQFFTFADQIEQRVNDAKARVDKLTQSILAKAFRGELTADWRAEHPELIRGENSAEALLAKIQAAKVALDGKKKKGKAA